MKDKYSIMSIIMKTIPDLQENSADKLKEFALAMEKYKNQFFYIYTGVVVSVLIVFLQLMTLLHLFQAPIYTNPLMLILAFFTAYIITDFVNGLVHMYMDNNTNYTSLVGPFVCAFHLHHYKPTYTRRHPIKVYFCESGSKFWLLIYLFALTAIQKSTSLPYAFDVGLVSFGILSSVAELSHYWCHNATKKNKVIRSLQKYRLLLSKQHHVVHHRYDNMQYAFLNGMTDPLLNLISKYCYDGYKNNADKHIAAYVKTYGAFGS